MFHLTFLYMVLKPSPIDTSILIFKIKIKRRNIKRNKGSKRYDVYLAQILELICHIIISDF